MATITSTSPLAWSIPRTTEASCSAEAMRLARTSSRARFERRWDVAIARWLLDKADLALAWHLPDRSVKAPRTIRMGQTD